MMEGVKSVMEARDTRWIMGREGGREQRKAVMGSPCPTQMWTSARRAQAYVAGAYVRTCPALSAVFARLASGVRRVKRMWMSVPRSRHRVGQAAVTTRLAPFTVPAQLASAPEGLGPPAKVRVLGPALQHRHLLWGLRRQYGGRVRETK